MTTKRRKTSNAKLTCFPLQWVMLLTGLLLIFIGVIVLLFKVDVLNHYTRCITPKCCITPKSCITPLAFSEEMRQRWRAIGYTVFDLTGRK